MAIDDRRGSSLLRTPQMSVRGAVRYPAVGSWLPVPRAAVWIESGRPAPRSMCCHMDGEGVPGSPLRAPPCGRRGGGRLPMPRDADGGEGCGRLPHREPPMAGGGAPGFLRAMR